MKGDLTEGTIGRTMMTLAIPTLGGTILQTLNASINMVWIGRFLGEDALAAASNGTNVIFLFFSTLFGFGMAATVIVGQHLGRRDGDGARRAIGASLTLMMGATILVVAVGVAMTDRILHLMGTPPSVAPLASIYLKTMLLTMPTGSLALIIMMILRGAGDAITPLWTMAIGVVLTIILNPLFIMGVGPFPALGIVGPTVAIQISNIVSIVGMVAVIYGRDLPIRLRGAEFRYLRPQPALMRLVFSKGLLMGLQMMVATFSGLVMVGLVNHAGVYAIAAYGVAFQLWNYLQMPSMAVGTAVSAMAAQNIGAGRWDRVESITRTGLVYNLVLTGAAIALVTWFDRPLLGLFLGADSPALPIAEHIQLIAGWSFIFFCTTMIWFATVRANGSVMGPLIIMAVTLLGCRLGFAIFAQPWLGFDALWWAFPVGAIANAILAWAFYRWGNWRETVLADEAERAEMAELAESNEVTPPPLG